MNTQSAGQGACPPDGESGGRPPASLRPRPLAGSGKSRHGELAAAAPLLDEAGIRLLGLSSEAFIGIKLVRCVEAGEERHVYDYVSCMGHVGLRRAAEHLPLLSYWMLVAGEIHPDDMYRRLDGGPVVDDRGDTLLREFCSTPSPTLAVKQSGNILLQTIEFAPDAPEFFDVFTAYRHRQVCSPAEIQRGTCYSITPRVPTRQYIEDMWLHDSMEVSRTPRSAVYYPGSSRVTGPLSNRAFDRIADLPPPHRLGRGLTHARLAAHRLHARMTQFIFDAIGWDPEEFEGYRLQVENPLWAMDHTTHFPAFPRLKSAPSDRVRSLTGQPA